MSDVYFLGGADLEMQTIREILDGRQAEYVDRQLVWGATASAYELEIRQAVEGGQVPVLIELQPDLAADLLTRCVLIDHHGEPDLKDKPTAIEQVTARLGISPQEFAENRRWALVAANDRGHVAAMRKLDPPATDAEIRTIREADLFAQGITREMLSDAKGELARVRVVGDERFSVVAVS